MLMSKDLFFRLGLAKSAFKESIYEGVSVENYIFDIEFISKHVFKTKRRYPKFYQAHDSFFLFYKSLDKVLSNLKKSNKLSPFWTRLLNNVVTTDQYLRLNRITRGSRDLAVVAAISFLKSLLQHIDVNVDEKFRKQLQQLQSQQQSQQSTQQSSSSQDPQIEQAINDAVNEIINSAASYALSNALSTTKQFSELKSEAEESISVIAGSGGSGFTKEALSVMSFLEKPEEFRKRVRLLSTAVRFFRHFINTMPTSLSHLQQISLVGGVNGVTRMIHEKQLSDILPSELVLTQLGDVGKMLFALKIVQKQLSVYQRAAAIKPILFIDKSGSMADEITPKSEIPKISIASGLALAMYLKYDADIYFFDTEIEKIDRSKIVDTLLRISADGGTNIDPVLREILAINKPDYLYIIISDGITEASKNVLDEFAKSSVIKNTKLILININPSYNWVELLRKYNNVFSVYSVASFDEAVKKILS